jgi:hypothetical protein
MRQLLRRWLVWIGRRAAFCFLDGMSDALDASEFFLSPKEVALGAGLDPARVC